MKSLADIDWVTWSPTDRATLIFVVEGGRILLIEKKRGLGAGKVNGPGGRIEPGERAIDAAVRELREELCVGARGVVEHGELSFHFVDGYMLHCHVFRADGCEGEPTETEEAAPLWTPVAAIPFDRMWADDALWLPMLLAGDAFRGRFIFDGDRMVDHELVRLGPVPAALRADLESPAPRAVGRGSAADLESPAPRAVGRGSAADLSARRS